MDKKFYERWRRVMIGVCHICHSKQTPLYECLMAKATKQITSGPLRCLDCVINCDPTLVEEKAE